MKAIFHYDVSSGMAAALEAAATDWLSIEACAEADDERLSALLAEAEVLWHVLKPATAAVIAAAPRLKLIQKIGVGVNTIDLEAAKARGIAVCNMPGTNSQAVAEATVMLMLAALRRAIRFDRETRAGRGWALDATDFDRVGELAGRTVGLVGYGAVGSRVAPMLKAIGARVLYTATRPKPEAAAEWRDLDALLAEADVISLHLPQTKDTVGMIDEAAFRRMKPGAVLINTARGGLVDEAAFVAALDGGRLLAAGVDNFAVEPVQAGNPLLKRDNVVLSPHIAWLTPETIRRSIGVAVENCRRLRDGEAFLNRVV
jgi:phosphoglycerate dehydrogenase-like enzyme